MAITFYWSPRSSATRIDWALEELGVPFEKVRVDIQAGDQKKPEYLALNPNGKVPLLVDGGTPIFESVAILIHLGLSYGQDKGLWPSTGSKMHGQALAWIVWSAATLQPLMFRARQNADARPDVDKLIAIVESHLAKSGSQPGYFLGETFTYVDLAIASALGLWRMFGNDFSAQPNITRWIDACQSRAAFKKAVGAQ